MSFQVLSFFLAVSHSNVSDLQAGKSQEECRRVQRSITKENWPREELEFLCLI